MFTGHDSATKTTETHYSELSLSQATEYFWQPKSCGGVKQPKKSPFAKTRRLIQFSLLETVVMLIQSIQARWTWQSDSPVILGITAVWSCALDAANLCGHRYLKAECRVISSMIHFNIERIPCSPATIQQQRQQRLITLSCMKQKYPTGPTLNPWELSLLRIHQPLSGFISSSSIQSVGPIH